MRLYDIAQDYRLALDAWCEDDETPSECWADTLESIEGSFDDKARAYIAVILELEADEYAGMLAAKKITANAKAKANRADYLRSNLLSAMLSLGKNEVKCSEFSAKIPKPRPSLVVEQSDSVPDKYKTTSIVTSIDNVFLKKALIDGEVVDGAHIEYKNTLTIK